MSKKIDDLPFDQVHGPLYPTERRHEFPRDPPKRSACHRNHDKLSKWQDAVLVWRGGKYACYQLRITLRWQPVTPSEQSQPWPREGNVKYPTRETLTCRHRQEFLHCHFVQSCVSFHPLFSAKLKMLHFLCVFNSFEQIQGWVEGQGRFQVPRDGRGWKTQLHRGEFTKYQFTIFF